MTFLEFPIRRYQFTLVAFLCLVALGWYAFTSVPREEDPYFKIPGFTDRGYLPGRRSEGPRAAGRPSRSRTGSPRSTTSRRWRPRIRDGVSFTAIEFDASIDADKKYDEVTRELNALRPEFPPEVQHHRSAGSRPDWSTPCRSRWSRTTRRIASSKTTPANSRTRSRPSTACAPRKAGRIPRASCASRSTCSAWRS